MLKHAAPVWQGRGYVLAGAATAAVAANAWPWWPAAATIWVCAVAASLAWPPEERWEPMSPDFYRADMVKGARKPLLNPFSAARLGPIPGCEEQDTQSNPETNRWSPITYASAAAAVAAVFAAFADLALTTLLSLPTMPRMVVEALGMDSSVRIVWLTCPLSAFFAWWAVQSAAYAFRRVRYAEDEFGVPPAGVFTSGWSEITGLARTPWFAVMVPVAIGGFLAVRWTGVPVGHIGWVPTVGLIASISAAVVITPRFLAATREQQDAWMQTKYEERQWGLRWMGSKGLTIDELRVPQLMDIKDLPEEDPTHKRILFMMKPGTQFDNFGSASRQLASSLGSDRVVIERFENKQSRGQEQLNAFTVTYQIPGVRLKQTPHLDPSLDEETLQFTTRHAVTIAFRELKLATPLFLSMQVLTAPGKPVLHQSRWTMGEGNIYADVARVAPKLQELLKCSWFRPSMTAGSGYLTLFIGEDPDKTELKHPHMRTLLDKTNWSYLMQSCGLVGSNGQTPNLVKRKPAPLDTMEWEFEYAPGLDASVLDSKLEAIRSLADYGHLERLETPDARTFVLLTGDIDPLSLTHLFMDHKDEILRDPVRGSPHTEWATGVTARGEVINYSWDSEEPHLLVAGSTGSGKSGFINSMMCQLLHNNHPDDVRIWLVEPKNELQVYQHFQHVTKFVDTNCTSDPHHTVFASMLNDAVAEMKRRYQTFNMHPKKPQKLEEAREIAKTDPENSGYLNFPYLFIVVEECSNYFVKPLAEEKEAWSVVMRQVQKLAREARAAGIHLLVATQYPTKENLPTPLKAQCRRLGLRTDGNMASRVIIDRPGLEKLKMPGSGLISDGKQYVQIRGLLLVRQEGDDGRDDRADVLSVIPSHDTWPKLPRGVEPSKLVTPAGEPIEGSPVPGYPEGVHPVPLEFDTTTMIGDQKSKPKSRQKKAEAEPVVDAETADDSDDTSSVSGNGPGPGPDRRRPAVEAFEEPETSITGEPETFLPEEPADDIAAAGADLSIFVP